MRNRLYRPAEITRLLNEREEGDMAKKQLAALAATVAKLNEELARCNAIRASQEKLINGLRVSRDMAVRQASSERAAYLRAGDREHV